MSKAVAPVRVGDELEAAAVELATAGLDDAAWEARAIWAGLSGCSVGAAWLEREGSVAPEQQRRFRAAVARRLMGEPLAHVVGTAEFRTVTLAVDGRVLIPRPETEGLVEFVLLWCRERFGDASWGHAADIGTGSGCIALSLAIEGRFREIVATDCSVAALEVARVNLAQVRPPTPVAFREGELLTPLGRELFDVIVSNLPYITDGEFEQLPPSVRLFEPRIALAGGPDGLEHTRRLLARVTDSLRPGGLVALEVDGSRAEQARALARAAGLGGARVAPDLFGRPRFLLATRE